MNFLKKYLTVGMGIKIVCTLILVFTLPTKINDISSVLISLVLILLILSLIIQDIKVINAKHNISLIDKVSSDFMKSSFYKVNFLFDGETLTQSLDLFLEDKKINVSKSDFENIFKLVNLLYFENLNKNDNNKMQ